MLITNSYLFRVQMFLVFVESEVTPTMASAPITPTRFTTDTELKPTHGPESCPQFTYSGHIQNGGLEVGLHWKPKYTSYVSVLMHT